MNPVFIRKTSEKFRHTEMIDTRRNKTLAGGRLQRSEKWMKFRVTYGVVGGVGDEF